MKRLWIAGCFLALCGIRAAAQEPAIVVNGTPLTATLPSQQVGGELQIPLGPVARALGADVSAVQDQSLTVRRADGAKLVYDGRTGEIHLGATTVGQVPNFRLVRIAADVDQLLFPVPGMVALLGLTARLDDQRNVLYLDSLPGGAFSASAGNGFAFTGLDYGYSMVSNGAIFSQGGNLGAQALAGNVTLAGSLQASNIPGGQAVYLNQAAVRAGLPDSRSFLLGDQGAYSGVEALTSSLRGAAYEQPLGSLRASVYAGRGIGTTAATFGSSISSYDTNLAGISLKKQTQTRSFSAGANWFSGPRARGATAGLAFGQNQGWNQFKLQLAGGSFSGLSRRSSPTPPAAAQAGGTSPAVAVSGSQFARVKGPAYGLSVSEAFLPSSRLSVSGQFDYYSRSFLTAGDDARFNAASSGALAASFRPFRLLTLSGSAGSRTYLLGDRRPSRSYSSGAGFVLPGRHPAQLSVSRTLLLDPAGPGRLELRQYSAMMPSLGRYTASAFYSETIAAGAKTSNLNGVAGVNLYRFGRLDLHLQNQFHASRRAGGEWNLQLGRGGGYIRAGLDLLQARSGEAGLMPLAGLRLRLWRTHVLDVTYVRDPGMHTLQVRLGGKLIQPQELSRDSRGAPLAAARTSISGFVFIDTDYNGSLGPGDRPISDTRVWLDNGRQILTDATGHYRFDGVMPGGHVVRSELDGVPAGYVFAESGLQTMAALPNRDNRFDVRAIKTGQIEGIVTYLDYGEDPDEPVEKPLPDVHILASGDLDTFSEMNGRFLLGDLAPGTYSLHLDPDGLPEGYAPQPASVVVRVEAGVASRDVKFRLAVPPRPVIEIRAPAQTVTLPPPPPTPPASRTPNQQEEKPSVYRQPRQPD